ncbi:hypothetical protein ACW9YQ_08120 [Paraburkholderia strydomiana]
MDIVLQIEEAWKAVPGTDGILHGRKRLRYGTPNGRPKLFSSIKNGAFIPVRNITEFKYCYVLEADVDVIRYRTRPIELETRQGTILADFVTWNKTGKACVTNVLRRGQDNSPRTLARLAEWRAALQKVNVAFFHITERNLPVGIQMENLTLAYNRGAIRFTAEVLTGYALDFVSSLKAEERTVQRLQSLFHYLNYPPGFLEAAIFHGFLAIAGNRPYGPAAVVEVRSG